MGKFIISSETEINRENVADWLSQFENDIKPKLEELNSYYKGIDDLKKAKISKKKRIDNKIHVNLASMIVNNSVNYFIGKPISYKFDDGFNSETIEELQVDDIEEIENKSLAKDCSKFGIAYELVGIKETKKGTKELYYKRLDPLKTFLVVNDTLLEDKICFITYTEVKTKASGTYKRGYIYTANSIQEFTAQSRVITMGKTITNVFKDFPVIIYKNNDEMTGDYEKVTEMLSAYSRLYSCSFDDFESIANALLIFYNFRLSEEDRKQLNETSVLGVESDTGEKDTKAEYIYKKLDVSSFKELRNMMREDIFAITNVADFTDENFGGNQSGIAISYKLIGFENLRLDKAVYFKRGILERWKLIGKYAVNGFEIKKGDIELTFFANIPENVAQDLEYVELWKEGAISLKTLLSKMETVKDVDAELKLLEDEQKEDLKRTKEIMENEEIPQVNAKRLKV